jgi:hypothetical protein
VDRRGSAKRHKGDCLISKATNDQNNNA